MKHISEELQASEIAKLICLGIDGKMDDSACDYIHYSVDLIGKSGSKNHAKHNMIQFSHMKQEKHLVNIYLTKLFQRLVVPLKYLLNKHLKFSNTTTVALC